MFKCTGMCSLCKKCQNPNHISETDGRKSNLFFIPKDFESDTNENGYGIAFDIGTTTVVGLLWDFSRAKAVYSVSLTNPQIVYGADVISRIAFCSDENNLRILQQTILNCLNDIIEDICKNRNISRQSISKVFVCGNTAMSHFLLGVNPKGLASAPFKPGYFGTVSLSSEELGIHIKNIGTITVLPNIAGHIGSDIAAGILAVRLEKSQGRVLFIDIGTNGEIVYFDGKKMFACSAAAGPAFEGASITHGMRAASGAIERFRITDTGFDITVIGNTPPVGICGSGLIDIIAELVRLGIVDKSGRMLSGEEYAEKYGQSHICERLKEDADGRKIIIVKKENTEDIIVTQKDIREVQLAKAAIAAGINILLQKANNKNGAEQIFLAGAFGNYINIESAVAIGLLPDIELDKIIPVGNSAGTGTLMALASSKEMDYAGSIPENIEHINLYDEINFQTDFLNSMGFDYKK